MMRYPSFEDRTSCVFRRIAVLASIGEVSQTSTRSMLKWTHGSTQGLAHAERRCCCLPELNSVALPKLKPGTARPSFFARGAMQVARRRNFSCPLEACLCTDFDKTVDIVVVKIYWSWCVRGCWHGILADFRSIACGRERLQDAVKRCLSCRNSCGAARCRNACYLFTGCLV